MRELGYLDRNGELLKRGLIVCGLIGSLFFNTGMQGVAYAVNQEGETQDSTQAGVNLEEPVQEESVQEESVKEEPVQEEPGMQQLSEDLQPETTNQEPSTETTNQEPVTEPVTTEPKSEESSQPESQSEEGVVLQQEQGAFNIYTGISELSQNKPVDGIYKIGEVYDSYINVGTANTGRDLSNLILEISYEMGVFNEGVLADNLYDDPEVKQVEFADGVMRVYLNPVTEGDEVSLYLKWELQSERALNRVPYNIGVTLTNNEEVYYQNPSIQTFQGEYQPTGIDVTANNKDNGEILQNVSGHILYHFQLTTIPQASKEAVTYVYLPYYLTKSGEWEQAVFEPSINEGWVLSEDGSYVMYTQQVTDGFTVQPLYIDITFPNAVANSNIELEVGMEFSPYDERATNVYAEGFIQNTFAGRVNTTMPETGTTGVIINTLLAIVFMGFTGYLQYKKVKKEK